MRALYDPTLSERGVLLCAARKPRAKDPLDFEVSFQTLALRSALLIQYSTVAIGAFCLHMLSKLTE